MTSVHVMPPSRESHVHSASLSTLSPCFSGPRLPAASHDSVGTDLLLSAAGRWHAERPVCSVCCQLCTVTGRCHASHNCIRAAVKVADCSNGKLVLPRPQRPTPKSTLTPVRTHTPFFCWFVCLFGFVGVAPLAMTRPGALLAAYTLGRSLLPRTHELAPCRCR